MQREAGLSSEDFITPDGRLYDFRFEKECEHIERDSETMVRCRKVYNVYASIRETGEYAFPLDYIY